MHGFLNHQIGTSAHTINDRSATIHGIPCRIRAFCTHARIRGSGDGASVHGYMHALEDPGMGRPSTVNAEIDFEIRKIYRILLRNTSVFAVSRKITERKTAENAIQHTRAKFGNSDFPEFRKSTIFPRFENTIFRSAENRSFGRFPGFTM